MLTPCPCRTHTFVAHCNQGAFILRCPFIQWMLDFAVHRLLVPDCLLSSLAYDMPKLWIGSPVPMFVSMFSEPADNP